MILNRDLSSPPELMYLQVQNKLIFKDQKDFKSYNYH